jgi:hypothetical protein
MDPAMVTLIIEGVKILIPVAGEAYAAIRKEIEDGKARVELTKEQSLALIDSIGASEPWAGLPVRKLDGTQ